jgi:cytochrome c-type biogenesis protein CcmH/NrfG
MIATGRSRYADGMHWAPRTTNAASTVMYSRASTGRTPARRRPSARGAALRLATVLSLVAVVGAPPPVGFAEPSSPAAEQVRQPVTTAPSADSEFNRGVRARLAQDWPTAVDAFRGAIAQRAEFAEAWNELGFALRNQGRYTESLQAYDEALRLRPNFPEALEYLGEAYVKLGRFEDARRVLERLRPLDAGRAQELAEVIQKGS